ncbi:MAG: ABC transporter ATP-binding protein [Anaerolineales bacterium]|nr:ABC transporter ATP-binding protein [Anaerolineales bacterium]
MPRKQLELADFAWPGSRLAEMLENLARKSGLSARPSRLPQPPEGVLGAGEPSLGRWIDAAASQMGLEAEAVSSLYAGAEDLIRVGGPAILRLPGAPDADQARFIALLRGSALHAAILCPDLRVRKLRLETIREALCYPYEAQIGAAIDQILVDAQVPPERQARAHRAILRQQFGPLRIEAGWLLRLPPGAGLSRQFHHSGVYRPVFILLGMYFVQQVLTIASWYVIGRGIFQGHFDLGWLLAWAILLFSIIPVQIIVSDAQAELSMGAGAIFKSRLIHGTLKLEPEEIRHQGLGQFLGRVMESEAVEMLALSGGFMAVLSVIELFLAFFILAQGVGGAPHAALLAVWTMITLFILWRYYQNSREWASAYREMTNDLVERLVGHRTRLIQEDPQRWHEDEDQLLDRYLKLSENMDRIGIQIDAVIHRGWLIVGLLGVVLPFVAGSPEPAQLAISLGGVLLASQALGKLAGGAQSLVGLLNAWQQVGPLFHAATRPDEKTALNIAPPAGVKPSSSHPAAQPAAPLLSARDLSFRYRPGGRPVLQEINLQINAGDRLLLEGPSGGGKSTLAALLTGLRKPEAGSMLLWGFDRQILGPEEWRRRVVMAPQFQENYVFSETFAFNLLMGRRWPPQPEDLEEAEVVCKELGLGELLDRMPSGFQQMLGESGWQLSHGERSRLFIARALLQKADLIILDESFGALDPENLYRALRCVLERASTVLVIAHP